MDQQTCAERGCPFPASAGDNLCRHHIEMYAFDESLTDSGLDYEALHSGDEDRSSGPVAQLSVTNWRDTWLEKKERRENKIVIAKFYGANRYRQQKSNKTCPRCRVPHSRKTVCCEKCHKHVCATSDARRAKLMGSGLCKACGKPRDNETTRCEKCRKKNNSSGKASRLARFSKGLCQKCGDIKQGSGRWCMNCRAAAASRQGAKSRTWKAAGLCVCCGAKKPGRADKVLCLKCVARQRERRRKIRRQLTQRGRGTVSVA